METKLARSPRLWVQENHRRMENFSHSLALERTATRRVSTFQMIKTVSVEATLALGGGRSACPR
jgi:hypothetical protein